MNKCKRPPSGLTPPLPPGRRVRGGLWINKKTLEMGRREKLSGERLMRATVFPLQLENFPEVRGKRGSFARSQSFCRDHRKGELHYSLSYMTKYVYVFFTSDIIFLIANANYNTIRRLSPRRNSVIFLLNYANATCKCGFNIYVFC